MLNVKTDSGDHDNEFVKELCEQCDDYINLDVFTLADFDGDMYKYQESKKAWGEVWFAITGNHIAYYNSQEDVNKYIPRRVLHVDRHSIELSKERDRECEFSIKGRDRTFYFAAYDQQDLDEWFETFEEGNFLIKK